MQHLKSIPDFLSWITGYDLIIFTFAQSTCEKILCLSIHLNLGFVLISPFISRDGSDYNRWRLLWISNYLRCWLLNRGYIVTIFYNLPHIQTCGLDEESHFILPIWIIFTIKVRRVIYRVTFCNMIYLLSHLIGSLTSAPNRKFNLKVRLWCQSLDGIA